MRSILLLVVLGLTAGAGLAPAPAAAQTTVNYTTVVNNRVPPVTFTVQGVYWQTMSEFVTSLPDNGGNLMTWNGPMYGLDLRVDTQQHWGLHLNGMTGNQSAWSFLGSSAGVSLSGTDTIWSVDVSYLWQAPVPTNPGAISTFRGFVGWGDAKASTTMGNLTSRGFAFNSATLSADSSGVRVGFDFSHPFASDWLLTAGVTYFPSTTTTGTIVSSSVGAASYSTNGNGWDAFAGLRYTFSGRMDAEVGWRFARQNMNAVSAAGTALCPCHTQWTGPYGAVGVSF